MRGVDRAQRLGQHVVHLKQAHTFLIAAVRSREDLALPVQQPQVAGRIVEGAYEAVDEVERHCRADHADRAPVGPHRGGVADHPARARRIGVGFGPVRRAGLGLPAIEQRHISEAREDLVVGSSAHVAAETRLVGEREDGHEVVLPGAEVAPTQIRHCLMRQLHVLDQFFGQPVVRRSIAARREVGPVQHRAAVEQLPGVAGGQRPERAVLVAERVDLAPGPEPPDVILHRLDHVAQQDVVLDGLTLELLEQCAMLVPELEHEQCQHHQHERHHADRGDQRIAAKRHRPVVGRRLRVLRCARRIAFRHRRGRRLRAIGRLARPRRHLGSLCGART